MKKPDKDNKVQGSDTACDLGFWHTYLQKFQRF